MAGFVAPVFWAAVLAIVFRPVESPACSTGSVEASEFVGGALTLVLVIVRRVRAARDSSPSRCRAKRWGIYQRFTSGELAVSDAIDRWVPALVRFGTNVGITPGTVRANVAEALKAIGQFLASGALAFGQNAIRAAGQFGLMLYVLFFFLRDGDQLLRQIARALPLGDARERALFERFTAVTRATLKGTLVVGAVQGTLGGIFFALLGLEGPVLWGAIMWACSLIPVIGPTTVWLPTAIILLLTGSIGKGITLLLLGTFVIALADNILRPILVGRETRIPDYVVLLSTLGGIGLFGLSGFVAGPAIAALFITTWDMFAREYSLADKTTKSLKPES
jgi:predicted PurR-regulated permease PerM